MREEEGGRACTYDGLEGEPPRALSVCEGEYDGLEGEYPPGDCGDCGDHAGDSGDLSSAKHGE